MSGARVAADVGGTFTDVVIADGDGRMRALKVPSTPGAFERGVLDGVTEALAAADLPARSLHHVLHATTAGTNAVLERSGTPPALVTTAAFRDVLEIGRLRTPTIYDLGWEKPAPLVPRHLRLEVAERIGADGAVVTPLSMDGLAAALRAVVAAGVRSVAVSLLNAHVNPSHEDAVATFVRERFPELLVTTGTGVVREIGEYERTSTAVINAYLRPVISAYLGRLASGLVELGADVPVMVMQSSGGMMPVAAAAELPVHLLESGPAAGVLAAASVARATGDRRAIGFDMGGTTAKASLIEDFAPLHANEFSVGSELSATSRLIRGAGYAVRLPVVDLAEVGAGGGSIARVDSGGALRVGPESAGAMPGPACYVRGGTAATVTDANLILGYLSEHHLLASGAGADLARAEEAVDRDVAVPLGLAVVDAALAVHRIADQQMARVLRAVSTERGRMIGDYTLIAFGGSGGLHAASLAEAVGITRVVVPPLAGVLSAVGLLQAPVELSVTETVGLTVTDESVAAIAALVDRLAAEQWSELDRILKAVPDLDDDPDRDPGDATEVLVDLDVRFPGEASELTMTLPGVTFDAADAADLVARFHACHLAEYGHGDPGAVEVVRARVTARRPQLDAGRPLRVVSAGSPPPDPTHRTAHFGTGPEQVPVVARGGLQGTVAGPLLIDEADTTTVVPPGWTVRRDNAGNLVLEDRS